MALISEAGKLAESMKTTEADIMNLARMVAGNLPPSRLQGLDEAECTRVVMAELVKTVDKFQRFANKTQTDPRVASTFSLAVFETIKNG